MRIGMKQTDNYVWKYGWEHYLSIRGGNDDDIDNFRITEGFQPARIVTRYNRNYLLASAAGLVQGEVNGKHIAYSAFSGEELRPATGDWVTVSPDQTPHGGGLLIREILPRYGVLSRNAAGRETKEQVIASNIDLCFIVTSLDDDFSISRIERFLIIAREACIESAVLLNKADAARPELIARVLSETEKAAGVSPVFLVSARSGQGMEQVAGILRAGKTAVLVGSSGVGKSSIINYLFGESRQDTREVRETDSKGRHTTVRREIFVLPSGGLIIDSPGIRGLKLWATESSLNEVFTDIDELSKNCRFSDCSHDAEPGCAVRAALRTGSLPEARFSNYMKMRRELKFLESRKDELAQKLEKAKWKSISKQAKEYFKLKRGG